MAQGKGGVYGSFVMVKLTKGTSKRFKPDGAEKEVIPGYKSSKSHMVYVKEPVAKFFGFAEVTPADMLKEFTKKVKTKVNGKEVELSTMVSQGATGAGRSVTVKFTKLVKFGTKEVASVKVAMPNSHTFGNMVQEIMESKAAGDIAAIVSPEGKSMTFKTPYNKKALARK